MLRVGRPVRSVPRDGRVAGAVIEPGYFTILALQRALGARYEDIPEVVRASFEAMSVEELVFLAGFGEVLQSAGMLIDVPGIGKCYIK